MDFERRSFFMGHKCPADFFSTYIRQYSQEEFCCFLFPDERQRFFEGIVLEENRVLVPSDKISSRRRRFLLEDFFGKSSEYGGLEVGAVERIMALLAMPFRFNGRIFYPMFQIEEMIKKGGYNAYKSLFKLFYECGRGHRWCKLFAEAV